MSFKPELSVILTTYQRPEHLRRSLASLALQQGAEGKFEVIVADDGSADCTHNVVHEFARSVDFPVKLTSHPHRDYRVALSRNDGVRASIAPYLLFSDGDCFFPPDHLQKHLAARRPGVVRAGDSYRLDQQSTASLDLPAIQSQAYRRWISRKERRRMQRRWIKDQFYQLVGHRVRPKLTACNIGIARCDLEAVNGFDESFVGWGCEDDDLAIRLRRAGMRILSVLGHTHAYHMWHPAHETRPGNWADGRNVWRLRSDNRPTRCQAGLVSLVESPEGASFGDREEATHRNSSESNKAA